jgi:hypothetical protein
VTALDKRRGSLLWDVAIPLLLFLVALLPRIVAFGSLGNPDELGWLDHAVAFYDALARGDWASTLQDFHPGVVPMWGFGALLCARYGLSQLQVWRADGTLPLAEMARTALWFPIVISVLTVLAVYWLVRRLSGRKAALLAALLVALEPYYLAFTHGIHVDLTQASLMVVAALLWLNFLHQPRRWPYLVGSGIVSGLSLLTRSQALYMVPFSLLAAGVYFLVDQRAESGLRFRQGWKHALGHMALAWLAWLGILAATVFALWPALWVEPGSVLQQVVSHATYGLRAPHRWPVFFRGEVIYSDPGLPFYLLVLLFRLRPLTLILALLNPFLLLLAWRRLSPYQRVDWALGQCYVLFYLLEMALGAHKLERYLLPVIPMLSILAGVGLAVLTRGLPGLFRWRRAALESWAPWLAAGVAVVLLAVPWLRLAPDFDAYFNPLAGGGKQAAQLFTVGSGEALDEAAAYLNQKPDIEDLWALSFYPDVFGVYFEGHAQSPRWAEWTGLPLAADYMVVTLGQVQRDLYPTTLSFFSPREPEHTVHINDLDYAWLYAVPRHELSSQPPVQHLSDANFESRVRLLGYDVGHLPEELLLTLYWQPLASVHDELAVHVRLVDDAGRVVAEREEPPWSGDVAVLSWPDGTVVQDEHRITLPPDLTPGNYSIAVSLEQRDLEGTTRMLRLEGSGETDLLLGPVDLHLPEPSQSVAVGNLGNVVRLVGYEPSLIDPLQAGSTLPLTLTWECLAPMSQDYTVFVHLAGKEQQPLAQTDSQPLRGTYPTSHWDAGGRLVDPYLLEVPPQVPPGEYELLVGMYLLTTGERLPLFDAGGQLIGDAIILGTVSVTSP